MSIRVNLRLPFLYHGEIDYDKCQVQPFNEPRQMISHLSVTHKARDKITNHQSGKRH